MEGAMASACSGVMNSVLTKLTALVEEEYGYGKLKGVRKQVLSLGDELSSMKALLERLADMDELDAQAKEWRNQVREMSYDIEDSIDTFMHTIGSKNDGFVKKTIRFLKDIRVRHQIANKIQDIKSRVNEVNERRMRYKLDEYVAPDSSYVRVDPRVVAMFAEADSLVGIDIPREEVIKLLLMNGEKELRVASIVGFGGLGKTTIANQVYHKLRAKFDCGVFVSVSQKPDIPRLLGQTLRELRGQSFPHTGELDDCLKSIREYLEDKSYFVIIDDLWESSAWNIISCAFPKNKCGSRVLTTTRIHSVAIACCSYCKECVYNLRPLDEGDSRRLFSSRIFGREACPEAFQDISGDILKRCGGMPLAIISISGLLAGQSMTTWEYVRKSLGSMFEVNSQLEDVKQILDLSYKHLPQHLKTCLLYVGIYPEDYEIHKIDLVRQWIAEGFVSKTHQLDANDVAECYFNELVNRCMLQPVRTYYFNGEVVTCRMHDLMLDLIRSKSAEENFIVVIDSPQVMTVAHKNIRRVSLQYDIEEHGVRQAIINGSPSQVRSVAIFRRTCWASFLEFKFIRVLILKHLDNQEPNLASMCELFLLTYLMIEFASDSLKLPSQIGKLQRLKTIHIRGSGQVIESVTIPSELFGLSQLEHLSIPYNTVLPNGIRRLTSLRTLEEFNLAINSIDNIEGLSELSNMSDLKLCCSPASVKVKDGMYTCTRPSDEERRAVADAMQTSLERLSQHSCLRNLELDYIPDAPDVLSTLSPPPCHLRRLHLSFCRFPRIPKWIAGLRHLYSLQLEVNEVTSNEDDGVGILAGLPSLIYLYLNVEECPKERVIIGTRAFQSLEYLQFSCPKLFLAVEAGAMPRLHKLQLWLDVRGWSEQSNDEWLPVGVERLPAGLTEIHLCRNWSFTTQQDLEAGESALRNTFDAARPGFNLIFGGAGWPVLREEEAGN